SDNFGSSLAAGDFNADGHDDLAVGAPYKPLEGLDRGHPVIFHGHVGGLYPAGAMEVRLGNEGLPDQPEHFDLFGSALAVGDFNDDGYDDLAIGAPGEDGIGAVLVLYGSVGSLRFDNALYFSHY